MASQRAENDRGDRSALSNRTRTLVEAGSCVLCNGPDTLDLAVCLDCASRTGNGLVFVRQSVRRAERDRVIERLQGILPPGVEWEAFELATKGYLPLASVPLAAGERVFEAFGRDCEVECLEAADLTQVAQTTEQPERDPWGAARPARELEG